MAHIKLNNYEINSDNERVYENPLPIIADAFAPYDFVQVEIDSENHLVKVRTKGSASYFAIHCSVYGYGTDRNNYGILGIIYYDSSGRTIQVGSPNSASVMETMTLDIFPTKDGVIFGTYCSRFAGNISEHGNSIYGYITNKYNVIFTTGHAWTIDTIDRNIWYDKYLIKFCTSQEAVQIIQMYGDDIEGFLEGVYLALICPTSVANTIFTATVDDRNFYLISAQNNAGQCMLAVEV